MTIEKLRTYKNIVILGYGKEGKATEAFLRKNHPVANIAIADKNQDKHYLENLQQYDLAIKTPGIPKSLVTIPYTTATNLFFANATGTIIGVTGSKGKSTTASLIHHVLSSTNLDSRLIGNIGTPMLTSLDTPYSASTIFVVELSSYQLDDIQYSPHITVITSLFPEHMNYHGSIELYYGAKHNLLQQMKEQDIFVYNPRYQKLEEWARSTKAISHPYDLVLPVQPSELPIIGDHNVDNARAATTVARLFHLGEDTIAEGLKSFTPLPHRLQQIGTFHTITFYDDAISTTPDSTIAAMKALRNIGTLMLGGENRGYDFSEMAKRIVQYKIPNVVLFPDSGKEIEKELQQYGFSGSLFPTRDMAQAVQFAYEKTPPNTICLLSTASPSYSLWKNFEEKGDLFAQYVRELSTH